MKKRIREVLPVLEKYYKWIEQNFKTENGLYSVPLAATMMENSPRDGMAYPIDFNSQMALAAFYMSELADIVNDKETNYTYKKAYFSLKTKINALMWDERDGFYYDLDASREASEGEDHRLVLAADRGNPQRGARGAADRAPRGSARVRHREPVSHPCRQGQAFRRAGRRATAARSTRR